MEQKTQVATKEERAIIQFKGEPKIGEIRRGRDLNYKGKKFYIWYACQDCGKPRWVRLYKGKPCSNICRSCARKQYHKEHPELIYEQSYAWKGGRIATPAGYIRIKLQPMDFFFPMADKRGYVFEHRLIMAQKLGRCLQPWEVVHHKDGIRNHNSSNNLQLSTRGSHALEHDKGYRDGFRQGYFDAQNIHTTELQKQIKLLQWHICQFEKITEGRTNND